MAYDRNKIYKQALALVDKHFLYFASDVIAFLPISRPTFYEFFPDKSDELNNIKEKLESNKVVTKVEIRKKLKNGDKATELLALYKLIGNEDERKALSMSYQNIDADVRAKSETKLTDKQLSEVIKALKPGNE